MKQTSQPMVLCSTGAMGYTPDLLNTTWLSDAAPKLPCGGFELMIYSQWKAEDAAAGSLRAQGLRFPVAHLSKRLGERYGEGTADSVASGHALLRDNCMLAHTMGAKLGVLHLWGLPFGDDRFDAALAALGQARSIAAEYDVELLVETLPCRAQPLMRRMEQIVRAYPDCRFTADTRLLCCEGALWELLECDWLWEEERIAHVHVSDCTVNEANEPTSHPILLPGRGIVDFPRFFDGLRRRCYRNTVTLESPAPKLPDGAVDIAALAEPLAAIGDWLSF